MTTKKKSSGKVVKKETIRKARQRVRAAKETTIAEDNFRARLDLELNKDDEFYNPILAPEPVNPMLAAIERASRP